MSGETIALFGATGGTGKHFLSMALEAGYTVKIMVRTPSKITLTNNKLTVIEGDFFNKDAIQKTITGADYVVSLAGGPMTGKQADSPRISCSTLSRPSSVS